MCSDSRKRGMKKTMAVHLKVNPFIIRSGTNIKTPRKMRTRWFSFSMNYRDPLPPFTNNLHSLKFWSFKKIQDISTFKEGNSLDVIAASAVQSTAWKLWWGIAECGWTFMIWTSTNWRIEFFHMAKSVNRRDSLVISTYPVADPLLVTAPYFGHLTWLIALLVMNDWAPMEVDAVYDLMSPCIEFLWWLVTEMHLKVKILDE